MKKIKHSKYKNTGILFELLVRQIATDTLNNKDSMATSIIKNHFGKKSELVKELKLYQSSLKENFDSDYKASEFLNIVLKERLKLNNTNLNKQKYNLIRDIKKNYVLEDFFKSPSDDIVSKVNEEYSNQPKEVRLLAWKMLVENFNSKYTNLSTKQRSVLKEYINSVDNSDKLKTFVVTECDNLTKILKSVKISDNVINIKVNEVLRLTSKLKTAKTITESQVLSLLRYYELYGELKKVYK